MEHVNHPKHYNSHPNGIECIDIIRHYTCDIANALKYLWRAGLKPEMGKEDAEKEIEDLQKALWYIEDFRKSRKTHYTILTMPKDKELRKEYGNSYMCYCEDQVYYATGYYIEEIITTYIAMNDIQTAMYNLLQIGLIYEYGTIYMPKTWRAMLKEAAKHIQHRILDIEQSLLDKELKETVDVMHGQAVDGEDYVSKPGCVRETEPEHYDPLNMIVAFGRVYSLTDEVRKKPNGALYTPCENCDLSEFCINNDGTEPLNNLCCLHAANNQQYYREVGVAKYSPRFGTVEVVDEMKEAELELKRLEEDN